MKNFQIITKNNVEVREVISNFHNCDLHHLRQFQRIRIYIEDGYYVGYDEIGYNSYPELPEISVYDFLTQEFNFKTLLRDTIEEFTNKLPTKEYKTLNYKVNFKNKGIKIGCQFIDYKDAVKLAEDILEIYSTEK